MNIFLKIAKNKINCYVFIVLAVINTLVFGLKSSYLGFYADDPTFLLSLGNHATYQDVIKSIQGYVPGRNLHILWQYIILKLAGGGSLDNLAALHYFQVLADMLISFTCFVFLRMLGIRLSAAFLATLIFTLFPNHGETHFWLSALPMNLMSTFLILLLLIFSVYIFKNEFKVFWSRNAVFALFYWLIYMAAIFTYDQAVPVALSLVTILLFFLALQNRNKLLSFFFIWLFFFFIPVALILVWKLWSSGNGPGLTNISAPHVFLTFLYSIGIWLFVWIKIFFFPVTNIATIENVYLAIFITSFSLIMFMVLIRKDLSNIAVNKQSKNFNIGTLFLPRHYLLYFGVCFFILAYLPNYIWSISPRHNYLPSLGVAIIIAWALDSFLYKLWVYKIFKYLNIILIGLILFSFSLLNILEKNYWIESYNARKNIYEEVVKTANPSHKALLFSGFPSSLCPAKNVLGFNEKVSRFGSLLAGSISPPQAFLLNEQPSAILMFSNVAPNIENLSLHPITAPNGFFINNERRWGSEALIFIDSLDAIVVNFDDYQDLPIFAKNCIKSRLGNSEPNAQKISPLPLKPEFSVTKDGAGFLVSVPMIDLSPGEVLTLVGYEKKNNTILPAFFSRREWDWEDFQIPIGLGGRNSNPHLAGTYKVSFPLPLGDIEEFKLFSISAKGMSRIAETKLIR